MVGNSWREHPMQRRDQSPLLRLQCRSVVDGASGGVSHPALSDLQAGAGVGRPSAQGERGTKVYFVKQLQIQEDAQDDASPRLLPMMREYTVFNVDQCEDLPDRIKTGKPLRVRNLFGRPC